MKSSQLINNIIISLIIFLCFSFTTNNDIKTKTEQGKIITQIIENQTNNEPFYIKVSYLNSYAKSIATNCLNSKNLIVLNTVQIIDSKTEILLVIRKVDYQTLGGSNVGQSDVDNEEDGPTPPSCDQVIYTIYNGEISNMLENSNSVNLKLGNASISKF